MPAADILDIVVSAPAAVGNILVTVAEPDAEAVAVQLPSPAPVEVSIYPAPGGLPGPAGNSITPVVLTASDYYNLPVAEQLDPWKIYIIPVLN